MTEPQNGGNVQPGDSERGARSTDGTVRLDSAKVVWKDDEYATAAGIPVEILSNGWIYTPETNEYHPPNEVERVERYVDTETDRSEGGSHVN